MWSGRLAVQRVHENWMRHPRDLRKNFRKKNSQRRDRRIESPSNCRNNRLVWVFKLNLFQDLWSMKMFNDFLAAMYIYTNSKDTNMFYPTVAHASCFESDISLNSPPLLRSFCLFLPKQVPPQFSLPWHWCCIEEREKRKESPFDSIPPPSMGISFSASRFRWWKESQEKYWFSLQVALDK